MHNITQIYIDGRFVTPHGSETLDLINPTSERVIGRVALGDARDAQQAVAAAKKALPAFSQTSKGERMAMLRRLYECLIARNEELRDATIQEYGGVLSRASWVSQFAAQTFLDAATTLQHYELERAVGRSVLVMSPVGVCALLTPWNSNAGSICSKLAMVIAAGCTSVVKPSELSAIQTQIVIEALHAARLPAGVINIVNGRGDVVGSELSTHPDVARISFTGSTETGKAIARLAVATMKRVSFGLSGKSPTLILQDANFAKAVPDALGVAFQNNGQACIAGSRLLVPRQRMAEVIQLVQAAALGLRVGDPADAATILGPMASRAQFERVQGYIQSGLDEGALLVTGGLGKPEGLSRGFFVRPTVFCDVSNDMRVAREEIFGPVLCLLPYIDEDEAVAIAYDSPYGLHAYVFSEDVSHAKSVARRLDVGRVAINGKTHDPLAPFGGYKMSGLGREYGVFGLESFLEAKAIMVA